MALKLRQELHWAKLDELSQSLADRGIGAVVDGHGAWTFLHAHSGEGVEVDAQRLPSIAYSEWDLIPDGCDRLPAWLVEALYEEVPTGGYFPDAVYARAWKQRLDALEGWEQARARIRELEAELGGGHPAMVWFNDPTDLTRIDRERAGDGYAYHVVHHGKPIGEVEVIGRESVRTLSGEESGQSRLSAVPEFKPMIVHCQGDEDGDV
jgi:hypothetical protein